MDTQRLELEAVRRGFVTYEQMLECLRIREEAHLEGKRLTLGEILVGKGYLSEAEVARLVRARPSPDKPSPPRIREDRPSSSGISQSEILNISEPDEEAPVRLSIDVDQVRAEREEQAAKRPTDSGWKEIPTSIGSYKIFERVGQGTMGPVYKAARGTDPPVALRLWGPTAAGDEPPAEIEHPNLVQVLRCEQSGGSRILSAEFVEGETLKRLVNVGGALNEGEALRIGRKILAGLGAVHARGLVHGGVSPDRVILGEGGGAKLLPMRPRRCRTAALAFAAPECHRGEDADGRADLYSLGAVLFFVLTGVAPFRAESPSEALAKQSEGEVPDPRRLRPGLGGPVVELVRKLLAPDRGRRFGSAAQADSAVARLLGEQSSTRAWWRFWS